MSEKKPKKKRVRGLAGIVWKMLEPLNNNEKFNRRFKNVDKTVLLNAKDGRWAAIVKIKHGIVDIDGVKNGDKKFMKKLYKEHECDGKLETTTPILLNIAIGKLSVGGMVKKVISRKIKVKGIKSLLVLNTMFMMLQSGSSKTT